MLEVIVNGAQTLTRHIATEHQRHDKALNTAVKVRGYALMRMLKKEIRAGAPGGKRFAPLREISRANRGRGRNLGRGVAGGLRHRDRALDYLAYGIGYQVAEKNPFTMAIGFVGPNASATWRRIAKMQQEGFTGEMAEIFRHYYRVRGARMGRRSAARKFFFLRKSTRRFTTPARPIVEPFIAAHRAAALRAIRADYIRKLRGERI
jgi:hypothetical protein